MRIDARKAESVEVIRSVALIIGKDEIDERDMRELLFRGEERVDVKLPNGSVVRNCIVKDRSVSIEGKQNLLYLELEEDPE